MPTSKVFCKLWELRFERRKMKKTPQLKISEKQIQAIILDYLRLRKVFCWRQSSGAFKTEAGGFYHIGVVGAPDIFAVKKTALGNLMCGQVYGIEVKSEKGVLSDNQKNFQLDFEKAGGIYIIARSIEDVQKFGL